MDSVPYRISGWLCSIGVYGANAEERKLSDSIKNIYQETGDIIIFRRDGRLLVKRIAAVGGDSIDLGDLTYTPGWMIPKRDKDVVVVPEGCFFVLGDNAENSYDSRYWKNMFVKKTDVVAKVWE